MAESDRRSQKPSHTQTELRHLGGRLPRGVNIYFGSFPGYLWLSQDNQDSLVTTRKEIKFFLCR